MYAAFIKSAVVSFLAMDTLEIVVGFIHTAYQRGAHRLLFPNSKPNSLFSFFCLRLRFPHPSIIHLSSQASAGVPILFSPAQRKPIGLTVTCDLFTSVENFS